jgi:serine/threonine-protein kinase RsbW
MNHTLRIPAQISQLATARHFVEETGASLGLPRSLTDPLTLAVDETLSNIVQHGYQGQLGTVEIEIERTDNVVTVRLRDQGPPFDPTGLPDADTALPLDQRPVGGLGVYLTRRSVDSVVYERTAGGDNQLTLTKNITPA